MGALISLQHCNKVKSYVDVAKKDGGKVLCGDEELVLPEDNAEVCMSKFLRYNNYYTPHS